MGPSWARGHLESCASSCAPEIQGLWRSRLRCAVLVRPSSRRIPRTIHACGALVNKPFTQGDDLAAPRIRQICEGLVDNLILANEEGKADLIEHLAYPLPVIVIAEMLGIPAERQPSLSFGA